MWWVESNIAMNFQLNITCKVLIFFFRKLQFFIADLVISQCFFMSCSPTVYPPLELDTQCCCFLFDCHSTYCWVVFTTSMIHIFFCLIYLVFVLMFANKLNVSFFYYYLCAQLSGAIKLSWWYWHAFYTSIIHCTNYPVMMILKFIDFTWYNVDKTTCKKSLIHIWCQFN